jgi:hypothetical protein|tara:strand:- start:392 stop:1003 length:612 start_codon:yes stop_codon:yes gene_type:complete
MPLWGTTHDAIDNKPQHLVDDADSDYDITKAFASNKGWMMRNGAATGNGNTAADDEVLVAIGGLAGTSTSTGLKRPTITRVRWGESAYVAATAITVTVTWDELVEYDAGSAATLAIVSTGTNLALTATHIDGVAIADELQGNSVRFSGTTIDEACTLSIADDTVIGDPDLKDAVDGTALNAASKTITAAVKTASGYATRAVTT